MNEAIEQIILEMLRDAAGRDMTTAQLEALEHKIQVFRKAMA